MGANPTSHQRAPVVAVERKIRREQNKPSSKSVGQHSVATSSNMLTAAVETTCEAALTARE